MVGKEYINGHITETVFFVKLYTDLMKLLKAIKLKQISKEIFFFVISFKGHTYSKLVSVLAFGLDGSIALSLPGTMIVLSVTTFSIQG